MGFQEVFGLPTNIRHFYLELLLDEMKSNDEEKKQLIKAWQKTGSVPPIHLAGRMR